jgi:hypothetical protein
MVQLLGSNSEEEIDNVKHYSKLMVDAMRTLINNYKEVRSISPPTRYYPTHQMFMGIFEKIFLAWESYLSQFEALVKNPPNTGGEITFVADFRFIPADLQELNNTVANIGASSQASVDGGVLNKCFVVTAVYGSPLADEINPFRRYRDIILSKSVLGRSFIRFYYKVGPFLAVLIEDSVLLREAVKKLVIEPILKILVKNGF